MLWYARSLKRFHWHLALLTPTSPIQVRAFKAELQLLTPASCWCSLWGNSKDGSWGHAVRFLVPMWETSTELVALAPVGPSEVHQQWGDLCPFLCPYRCVSQINSNLRAWALFSETPYCSAVANYSSLAWTWVDLRCWNWWNCPLSFHLTVSVCVCFATSSHTPSQPIIQG